MARNGPNSFQNKPLATRRHPEHEHDVAAAHHLSEHTQHGAAAEGPEFLETLAADRAKAKVKAKAK